MLIERGAVSTAQTYDKKTPLHLALERGRVDVARIPIERGADEIAQSMDGKTLLATYIGREGRCAGRTR